MPDSLRNTSDKSLHSPMRTSLTDRPNGRITGCRSSQPCRWFHAAASRCCLPGTSSLRSQAFGLGRTDEPEAEVSVTRHRLSEPTSMRSPTSCLEFVKRPNSEQALNASAAAQNRAHQACALTQPIYECDPRFGYFSDRVQEDQNTNCVAVCTGESSSTLGPRQIHR